MKKLLLPVLLLCTAPVWAFLFSPGTRLKTVSTEYFDIIFSERTEASAFHLASRVDDIYDRVAALLGEEPDMRIPVVLSDVEADPNGFAILYPDTKIVIYDVPPDPESSIGNYRDYLVYLFTHELTHAVSLNIRGSAWERVRGIFGDYYTAPNNTWMMPMHMIEGVTVSFESLEGNGRLNDPYIRQHLIQAALEDEFLTSPAASGALDQFPFASAYYFYGGHFSRYLQETYGMELYADLWEETGKGWIIPGFSGAFQRVYGKKLKDEWEAFAAGFVPEEEPGEPPAFLIETPDYIVDMAAHDRLLYYISGYSGGLHVLDTATGKNRFLLELENPVSTTMSLSADGSRLVLGLLENTAGGTRRVVRVYDLERRGFTDIVIPDLRQPSFVSGGIAGVLVRDGIISLGIHKNGEADILLKAPSGGVLGRIEEVTDGRYVFIANVEGRRDLYLYDEGSGAVNRIVLPLEGETWPRGMTVRDGKIFFTYNNDASFYRLGMIDGMRFYRQSGTVFGGVFHPAPAGDRLFHASLGSDGWYLAEYPEPVSGLISAGRIVLEPADAFLAPGRGGNGLGEEPPVSGEYSALRGMAPHFVFPYVDPGTLVFDDEGRPRVNGLDFIGLQTYGADPAEGNEWSAYGGYVWRTPFAEAGFEVRNTSLPVGLSFRVSDSLVTSDNAGDSYRQSSLAAGFSLDRDNPVSGVRYGIRGNGGAMFGAPEESGDVGAYGWNYQDRTFSGNLTASAGFSPSPITDVSAVTRGSLTATGGVAGPLSISRQATLSLLGERSFTRHWSVTGEAGVLHYAEPLPAEEIRLSVRAGNLHALFPGFLDYEGISLTAGTDYRPADGLWKAEGNLVAAPPVLPVYLRMYGALSGGDVFTTDGVREFRYASRYPVFTEFSDRGPLSNFYTGGDVEVGLFNLEVQRKMWLLPLFLNRLNLSTGYRAAWNGGPYYHSAFARFGFTFSPLIGSYSRVHLSFTMEGAYSFTDGEFSFSFF